jgi:acetyl-CoA C-acetyltransferase
MAAHAIKAGEGDVFVAGGVETVSRFRAGMSDGGPNTHNARFADAEARSVDRSAGGQTSWEPISGLPDIYIAMGQTAENVAEYAKVTREEMDEFAARSQQRAVESQENGFFEREITPVTTPDGTVVAKDDGPRPGTTVEGLSQLKPVFRPDGTITAERVPAQRRCRRGARDERPRRGARRAAVNGSSPAACRRSTPRSWGSGRSACKQALARASRSTTSTWSRSTGVRRAGRRRPRPRDPEAERAAGDRARPPVRMTGARIMTTLLNGLDDASARYGLESMCVGGEAWPWSSTPLLTRPNSQR